MATWASLTAEQQSAVEGLANSLRSFAQHVAQASDLGVNLGAAWNGGVNAVVASLGSTEIIPNTSGLAGAQALLPADITNFVGYAINISDPANASQGTGGYNSGFIRALAVKLAGYNA